MKKISVVVPVYNVECFLAQCLNSLMCQTYKNLEIIIVDDESVDNSAYVYNKYANVDKRIKIIKQKNAGVSAARNAGLRAATGDYVHFIDSDDYISLDYYEKMMSLANLYNPDILAGGVVSQNGNLYNIQYKFCLALTTLVEKFSVTNALSNCVVWRYLFKRDFLLCNNLWFEVGRIFEDILFMPNAVLLADSIITVPDANYFYVFNENSLLNKRYSPNHQKQYEFAEQKRKEFINKHNLQKVIEKSQRNKVCIYKIIAFKIFKTVVSYDTNEKKYYLFGMRIMKRYLK